MTITNFMRTIPPDDRITPRQRELMRYLVGYQKKNGIAPTMRELTLAMGVSSKGSIAVMVDRLIKKGLLEKTGGAVRGLHVRGPLS